MDLRIFIALDSNKHASVDISALGASAPAAALRLLLLPFTNGSAIVTTYHVDSVLSLLARDGTDIQHFRGVYFYYTRPTRDILLAALFARGSATPPNSADGALAYFEEVCRGGNGPVRLGATDALCPLRTDSFPALNAGPAALLIATLDTPTSAFLNATGMTNALCSLHLVINAPSAEPAAALDRIKCYPTESAALLAMLLVASFPTMFACNVRRAGAALRQEPPPLSDASLRALDASCSAMLQAVGDGVAPVEFLGAIVALGAEAAVVRVKSAPNVIVQLEAVLGTGLASLRHVLTASVHGAMADCSMLISNVQAASLLDGSDLTSFSALAGLLEPLGFFPPGMPIPTDSELAQSYLHIHYL
ncbi:hypothetical protein T492DRAFT_894446 [Pavlovales sp. CCMP2436]|nr:hypothetical protein T492DRAFT_894446 [Pavlovales sp. CCMP2436]